MASTPHALRMTHRGSLVKVLADKPRTPAPAPWWQPAGA